MLSLKSNQIIKACLIVHVQADNYFNGCEVKSWIRQQEEKTFNSVDKLYSWLGGFGLLLDNFKRFDDRLTYCQNEDNDGNEITLTESKPDGYLVDYDLYLEVYSLDTTTDYLKDFERID